MASQTMDTRGKKKSEILAYFEEALEGSELKGIKELETDSVLTMTDVTVTISKEDIVALGAIKFPQVFVKVEGVEATVIEVVRKFRLNFLSAGG